MTPFDTALIEKVYSPITGWVTDRFGVDQWRLAMECLNGTIALYLAGVALTIAGKGIEDGIFTDLVAAFVWLAVMDLVRRAAQRQAASSLGRQTARMRESIFRHLLVAIVPLSLYYADGVDDLCHTASLLFFISHLYFKSCDSPPPQRRLQFARARA
ncbi:MAG TPA: hypothetical protein VF628_01840 [Allosphingosinicella sp.]|jgi:hypothetical protein